MNHHHKSGRIVIDVDPLLKRRLYASLSLSGSTLKDWFIGTADSYAAAKSPLVVETSEKIVASRSSNISKPSGGEVHKYSVVSMFSGCGGMDLGFQGGFEIFNRKYDRLPYEIIWANDLNAVACKTYLRNVGKEMHHGDIWKLLKTMPRTADVVIGGFPCQDISVNGKRAGVNGARSGLYRAMVEAIKRTKPKVFVAENVKGLLMAYSKASLEQVLADFKALGYDVHYQLYLAADYGVPQTRERVLFVGTRNNTIKFSPPTTERSPSTWMTAQEAIRDLERLGSKPEFNHIWSLANVSSEQGNRKLIAKRPAYTIRAECHGNIQYHYRLPRRISMREAARVQTFPDSFIFEGGLREIERQVGNAVPPVLAWHIAKAVLKCLE